MRGTGEDITYEEYEGSCAGTVPVSDTYDEDDLIDEPCGFDGTVTVTMNGHTGTWVCPHCGEENEVDAEVFGPDPDDHHDRMYTDD